MLPRTDTSVAQWLATERTWHTPDASARPAGWCRAGTFELECQIAAVHQNILTKQVTTGTPPPLPAFPPVARDSLRVLCAKERLGCSARSCWDRRGRCGATPTHLGTRPRAASQPCRDPARFATGLRQEGRGGGRLPENHPAPSWVLTRTSHPSSAREDLLP